MAKRKPNFEKFEDWTSWDVKQKLGVKWIENTPLLVDWVTISGEIPEQWKLFLENLRLSLNDHYASWKEEDLKMKFIAPLLITIPFEGEYYDSFAHSWLSAKVGDYSVKGFVDWMVAYGKKEPETPYFFLHEYKPFGATNPDPEGQLLIAMLAAQQENTDKRPIYGCFVVANQWYFVVLEDKTYSVSEGFDARKSEELTKIWLILNKMNDMVAEWAKNQASE